jgi:hypothetical protein
MKKLFLITIIFALFIFIPVKAQTIIVDGDLVKTSDNPDVYIVKLVGAEKFKRLILNPEIFNQYGHLKWENIKEISQTEIEQYIVSDLVRSVGDERVYKLYPQHQEVGVGVYPNGDVGEKRWIKTADDFLNFSYDWDAIYNINTFERDFYTRGEDLAFTEPSIPEQPATPEQPSTPIRDPITINIPSDYTTIQAAINAAIDGDTISIKSGTYNENINLNKSLKLIGETPSSVVVDGLGNDNAVNITDGKDILIQRVVLKSKDKYGIYCNSENAVKLTLKNSTLEDSGWGLVAENNCQVTMLNNLIYNNRNSANTDGAGILIKNNFSYGITSEIRNNTIDDNYHGIWSENSNVKVMNSIITSNIGGTGAISNTGIYHSGDGKSDNSFSNVYGNGLDFGGDARPGNGCIVVLPRFVLVSQRDYRLKTGTTEYSLCIDAGHPEYIYNDVNYTSNTVRNDMGAYGGPDNIGWTP